MDWKKRHLNHLSIWDCRIYKGGYLAIQLALTHNSPQEGLRAVVSVYPILGIKTPFYTQAYPKQMHDYPMYPPSDLEDHMNSIAPGSLGIVSNSIPPDRGKLAIATFQQGRFLEFLGEDPKLFPEERAKRQFD